MSDHKHDLPCRVAHDGSRMMLRPVAPGHDITGWIEEDEIDAELMYFIRDLLNASAGLYDPVAVLKDAQREAGVGE